MLSLYYNHFNNVNLFKEINCREIPKSIMTGVHGVFTLIKVERVF